MTTFAQLKGRLGERGFDYLTDATKGQFVNDAYLEICDMEDWPFLEATTSGVAPLAISDLRTIETVVDSTSTTRLSPLDRRHILETDYTLATTGSPVWYYLTSGTTVNVYPANTSDTLSVRYWKVPTALSADGDVPVVPDRYLDIVLYGARAAAYWDSDNAEMAETMIRRQERRLQTMRDALLVGQHDMADDHVVIVAGSADW